MKLEVRLISPPTHQNLVAELAFGGHIGGQRVSMPMLELDTESGELTIEIYSRDDEAPWVIKYDEFITALQTAKTRLLGEDVV
jgi:hypothetical protein